MKENLQPENFLHNNIEHREDIQKLRTCNQQEADEIQKAKLTVCCQQVTDEDKKLEKEVRSQQKANEIQNESNETCSQPDFRMQISLA